MSKISAINPSTNVTVMASAGSGKTWLLITRIIRLLMSGTDPGGILAITFTRKASAEMQTRLAQRLRTWLSLSDEALSKELLSHEIEATPEQLKIARSLYEKNLRSQYKIRITTFHAFCQDILQRFPSETDIPAGFTICESTGLLFQEAWEALWNEATQSPNSALAKNLKILLQLCGSINSMQTALSEFFYHRSDWWALTRKHQRPVNAAQILIRQQLAIDPTQDPSLDFINSALIEKLTNFQELLLKHATKTNLEAAEKLNISRDVSTALASRLNAMRQVFLTTTGSRRSRKASATLERKLGADGQQQFIELHEQLCEKLEALHDLQCKHRTFALSSAWYLSGSRLLEHFQRLKDERRQLDFSDLEWKVYQLLNDSENSHWVQYKLDQRINHFLIDEFQDTNPTQWQLLLPLLEELNGNPDERQRSVFLVGDEKQSIYRFRRADPKLFNSAHEWLENNLNAKAFPLNKSWRSSPAIINLVNRLFSSGILSQRLQNFPHHETHLTEMPGQVELLPLTEKPEINYDDEVPPFRNPLHRPRENNSNQQHLDEGAQIAARIKQLFADNTLIEVDGSATPLRYQDIIVLVRKRTHLASYESALNKADIPYIGDSKTSLLDNLEICDMINLLETLITPFNNLGLAAVLRSPLFSCSNDDLINIASRVRQSSGRHQTKTWMECLLESASDFPLASPLFRAAKWLRHWQASASHLPVHDLLDQIYSEGNLIERYQHAFPQQQHMRIHNNLMRFIELALEIDSGRYPSLPNFLSRLKNLQSYAKDVIEEPASIEKNSVRIMTIHAAKGLEAPIVFLADTGPAKAISRAYHALVDWPTEHSQPSCFLLTGKKQNIDSWSRARLDHDDNEALREEANLLYVAVTRARQCLIISGCASKSDHQNWYQLIASSYPDASHSNERSYTVLEHHKSMLTSTLLPGVKQASTNESNQKDLVAPIQLTQRLNNAEHIRNQHANKNPESDYDPDQAEDKRIKGIAIHRFLELHTAIKTTAHDLIKYQVAAELELNNDDTDLNDWQYIANAVINAPQFQNYFNHEKYDYAYNEVPISYQSGNRTVQGIIDRLVVSGSSVTIIDYKTQQDSDDKNTGDESITNAYREQMRRYHEGIKQLWPNKTVRSILLLTCQCRIIELPAL